MTNQITTINDVAALLEKAVDADRVITDPDVLKSFSRDTSLCLARKPDIVVKALSTKEVQAVVKLANEHNLPVTPRSSKVGFYGAGIPEQGGIVIDMSGMKKIRKVDVRNRWVLFEAGVTYGELQAELKKHGMRILNPLLPHKNKSVISSTLEREPKLTTKHHLDETIFTMEMVMPTGDVFHTGSMSISPDAPEKISDDLPSDLCNFHGPGLDWFRLIPGALGSFGIVTVMNAKIDLIPKKQKVVYFGFNSLEDCVEPVYRLLRKLIGDECFILNSRYLATALASDAVEINRISKVLPNYIVVLNLTAGEWFPEDKISYQEEALKEISRTFMLKPMEAIPGVPEIESTINRILYSPCESENFWKSRAKAASQEVFFLTPLQRAPKFLKAINKAAAANNFSIDDIGLYLQPKQNGRAFHMEASFPYDPENMDERKKAERVFKDVSEALLNKGAFFYRLYGIWVDMVYARTGSLQETLKRIKKALDPKNILSPGKLGF
jgi:FAD/FMN-containing dehydrogenase